jgi:hypothetical protein
MRVRDLPVVGCISNTEKDFYGTYANLSGKRVLCIGFTEDELHTWCRYDPSNHVADELDGPSRRRSSAFHWSWRHHQTQFEDRAFDATTLSCSSICRTCAARSMK